MNPEKKRDENWTNEPFVCLRVCIDDDKIVIIAVTFHSIIKQPALGHIDNLTQMNVCAKLNEQQKIITNFICVPLFVHVKFHFHNTRK